MIIQVYIGMYLKYTLANTLNYESSQQFTTTHSGSSTIIYAVLVPLLVILIIATVILTQVLAVKLYKRNKLDKMSSYTMERYFIMTVYSYEYSCSTYNATAVFCHFHLY